MMRGEELTAEEILERVSRFWNLHLDTFGPVPLWNAFFMCPVCTAPRINIIVQHWRYHVKKGDSRVRYRCDVGFKCTVCSAVWIHGVALPEWYWDKKHARVGRRVYWREANAIADNNRG